MARFQVPSASPPSTLGSNSNRSARSRSPMTPSNNSNGPNTFRVPSSHGTPTSNGGSGHGNSESPRSRRGKRSRSPSPEEEEEIPAPRRRNLNLRPPRLRRGQVDDDDDGGFWGGDRAASRSPGDVVNGMPGALPQTSSDDQGDPSSSSSSCDGDSDYTPGPGSNHSDSGSDYQPSDDSSGSRDDSPSPLPTPSRPSAASPTWSDISNLSLPQYLVGYQPERRPGRLGLAQPFPAQHLTLLKERPGRLPTHTARSPTSPGFDWGDGAAWWHPAGSNGRENIAREVFTETGFKVIRQEVAEQIADLMQLEFLVNILDGDGFGADQEDIRPEVLYEFCQGGTLNRLILSRRPEAPTYGPEAPVVRAKSEASYLPTRKVVLGLSEDLVWHVLLSLLGATFKLHTERWPVVHCAINPANVFFTAPKPDDGRPTVRSYGLVKLGGFGKVVMLPHDIQPETSDPEQIEAHCQLFENMVEESYQETGYEAPELLGMIGEDAIDEEQVVPGPHSDIFSIGATCFTMMTGKTIWDALLERALISRSSGPGRVDRAFVQEKWRYHDWEERMRLLEPLRRRDESLFDILPNFYSQDLRDFIVRLLDLDPGRRGESAALFDEVQRIFFALCGVGRGVEGMQKLWKVVTRRYSGRGEARKAIREWQGQFGPEIAGALRRNAEGEQERLVP